MRKKRGETRGKRRKKKRGRIRFASRCCTGGNSQLDYRRGNVTRPRACGRGLNCVPFLSNFFNLSRLGQLITGRNDFRLTANGSFSVHDNDGAAGRATFRIRDRQSRRDILHDAATCEWHVWCEINEEARKRDRRGKFAKRQFIYVGFDEADRERIKREILTEPRYGDNALRCRYCYQQILLRVWYWRARFFENEPFATSLCLKLKCMRKF